MTAKLHPLKLLLGAALLTAAVACMPMAQARELIVGVSETDYVPFYFEQEGKFHGAASEIAAELAARLGHSLTYQRFPWKRVQHNLATGRIDMVVLYFKTKDRAKHVYYAEIPHIYESSSLIVTNDSLMDFDGNLAGMTSHIFGNVTGYWHGADYSESTVLTKIEVASTRALLATLVRGKIDIAVGNKPVILGIAEEMGITGKLRFLEPKIDYAPDYIAFSKAKPDARELVRSFSEELKRFIRTDDYRAILQKYQFEIPSS